MNLVKNISTVVKFVASIGVGAVIKNAIEKSTPENTSTVNKLSVWVGTTVICGVVNDLAGKYVENEINGVLDMFGLQIKEEPKKEDTNG